MGAQAPASEMRTERPTYVAHRAFLALAYVTLAVAVGFVVTAALPSVTRALGWSEVRTVSRESPRNTSAGRAGMEALAEKERTLDLDEGDDVDSADTDGRAAFLRTKSVVYELPGKAPIGMLPAGTMVQVLGQRSEFVHVLYEDGGEGNIGWIRKSDLLVR